MGLNAMGYSGNCPEGQMYNFTSQRCEKNTYLNLPANWQNGGLLGNGNNSAASAVKNSFDTDPKKAFGLVVVGMILVVLVTVGVGQIVKSLRKNK